MIMYNLVFKKNKIIDIVLLYEFYFFLWYDVKL